MNAIKAFVSKWALAALGVMSALLYAMHKMAVRARNQRDAARREAEASKAVRDSEARIRKAYSEQREENAEHERKKDRSTRPRSFGDSRLRDD